MPRYEFICKFGHKIPLTCKFDDLQVRAPEHEGRRSIVCEECGGDAFFQFGTFGILMQYENGERH